MSATSRRSLTPLRSCFRTSSEPPGGPAAWFMASRAFRSARRSSWKSFSRWRRGWLRDSGHPFHVVGVRDARIVSIADPGPGEGTCHESSDFLSNDKDRWALDLLPGGRSERCADAPSAARASLLIADVRTSLRSPFRSLSPRRSGLPGLRTQRLAGPEEIRVYVRSLRRDHESLHQSARALSLHALHAGLRRAGGVSDGLSPSGPDRVSHRPGRC